MHGDNAEQKGHLGKEYWKSRLHRYGEPPGRYTKYLTHKKERRGIKQLLHILQQQIDSMGDKHITFKFANYEETWTNTLDSC